MIKAQAPLLLSCSATQDTICPRHDFPIRVNDKIQTTYASAEQIFTACLQETQAQSCLSIFTSILGKIDLTKRALKELDRRDEQAARPLYATLHLPITRRILAELKKTSQVLIPAVN